MTQHNGKCVCGSVEVTGKGEIEHAHACHCGICRGQNAGGAFHGVAFTDGADIKGDSIKWYSSSDYGERGFCGDCGSTIAWRMKENPAMVNLSLGLFESGTGAKIGTHIFSDLAGDYYTLTTDIPHKTAEQMFAEFAELSQD